MGYRREARTPSLATGETLTADLIGIGMLLAAKRSKNPNIEDTLLAASLEGMERGDLRVLSILVTWLGIHHARVNADRLVRLVRTLPQGRVRIFWASTGQWLQKDRRFVRLARLHRGPRVDLLETGSGFQIKRRGEDPRFENTCLRVPAGVLRDRPQDVLSPKELAGRHAGYRARVLMGPSYRADMWAALEENPVLTPTQLARRTYGSFATAWQVTRDRKLLAA